MVGISCDKWHKSQPHVIHGIREDVRTVIRGFYALSMFREAKFPPVNTVPDVDSSLLPQF